MFHRFKNSERGNTRKPAPRRLAFDLLEDRTVPAILPPISHVNTVTPLAQHDSVTASAINGARVVVWVHDVSATSSQLRAQRYDAAGAKVGPNLILVSGLTFVANPAVCMDNTGRFFVSYTRETSPTNRDVIVARFSNTGAFLGATNVATSSQNEYDSSIACNGGGNFTVSYTVDTTPTNQDIHAKRYLSTGIPLGFTKVAVSPASDETLSAIAIQKAQPWNISIVFVVGGKDVYHKRYASSGLTLGDMNSVAVSPAIETKPSVAMNASGHAVIAFQQFDGNNWNIRARKVFASGTMSTTILVKGGSCQDTDPSVAMDHTQLNFVVAYQSHQFVGNIVRVYASEVSASGGTVTHNLVSANALTTATRPSISNSRADGYIVSFAVNGIVGDPSLGILARFGVL